ncbi:MULTISPECIES: dynamin family protein [unclassified Coleofasciculus]|uniref:dynamin family protein n=1 Tax=unclassified Coleofasciculus TaxID=2692782 RepID=UPI00188076FB|nr:MULTISPECIES: dynamin family protein [unclassified Coleofasciculus]MBE9129924.1 dynamin family protein [Coleofasciculus sp. LEGE 07081]MBE9151457.1 dynamin family protein [Coleofasciculus sp. LEGE 07092]
MPNRSQTIASIIEKRQPLAQKIQGVEERLRGVMEVLRTLDERCHQLRGQIQDTNISDRLNAINVAPLQVQITHHQDELRQLRNRFSRNTLNIGVVGLMGQGKSTFLQSISGLTDDEIPALRGGACTAVRSTICHQSGETYADVTVHSEQTFLAEVITPYYQELELGTPPTALDEFAKPLPEFIGTDATKKSMYEHLKADYHDNISMYRHLLMSGSPRQLPRIPKGRIQDYVAQRRFPQGELISFDHLAVREVKIVCPFNNPDVGQVALVDVPGLGDTRLGDEKLILETLGQDVDLVIFVRRPDRLRYGWEKRDTDLYNKAAEALNNLENRSFMILNHVTGYDDNLEACQKHQTTIRDKHIDVIRCEIADCSSPQETNEVLDLVLNYLANNITYLDEQYARNYQKRLNQLQITINAELQKARQVWITELLPTDLNEQGKFLRLFNKLWTSITRGLEELLEHLDKARDGIEEDSFRQQVELIIQACKTDTGLPVDDPINQIIDRRFEEGDWQTTYAKYLHEIRNHLTRHFHAMDYGLNEYVEYTKSQVSEVLLTQGSLIGLSDARGSAFLNAMAEIVPDNLVKLKQAFQTLSKFEISYKANFHYRIRPHLDNLNPDKTNLRLSPSNPAESRDSKAKEILSYLEVLQDEAVFKCQHALEEFYCEPSQAAFAEVEEFVDQVLRAKDVKDEWQIFLFQEKAKVWSLEFGQNRDGDDRQQWLALVDRAVEANQLKELQFLH